jgi:hypothetical protein
MSRIPSAPASCAALAWATALAVEPVAGASTGTAPSTASTAARTTRSLSSGVSEKPSPVPPAAKSPATGCPLSHSRCDR